MSAIRLLLPGAGAALVAEYSEATGTGAGGVATGDALAALADLYAYPDPVPAGGWVRASMVASIDGAATGPDELSGSLGGPVDRAVLISLRGVADAVLVGAGTARAEGYRLPRERPEFTERRHSRGQPPAPVLAVVTRSGRVPDDVAAGLPGGAALLVTSAAADVAALRRRHGADAVLVAGEVEVDLPSAVARLDELCLTLAPHLLAGSAPRISHGPLRQLSLRLAHLAVADSVLLGRWLVSPPSDV